MLGSPVVLTSREGEWCCSEGRGEARVEDCHRRNEKQLWRAPVAELRQRSFKEAGGQRQLEFGGHIRLCV